MGWENKQWVKLCFYEALFDKFIAESHRIVSFAPKPHIDICFGMTVALLLGTVVSKHSCSVFRKTGSSQSLHTFGFEQKLVFKIQ